MKKSFKRTAAFLLALTIVSGGVPALTGGTSIFKSSIFSFAGIDIAASVIDRTLH